MDESLVLSSCDLRSQMISPQNPGSLLKLCVLGQNISLLRGYVSSFVNGKEFFKLDWGHKSC